MLIERGPGKFREKWFVYLGGRWDAQFRGPYDTKEAAEAAAEAIKACPTEVERELIAYGEKMDAVS